MVHCYPAASRLFTGLFSLLLFVGMARPTTLRAQTYSLPATGANTISTCSGTLYDNGGPNAPYAANANGSLTITPATAGNKIRLQFTSLSVESGFDLVYVYDGPSVNAPLIGTYDSNNPPGTLYGTTASGALTVRLTTDGSVEYSGFAATIGCVTAVPPQAQPDLALQGAALSPLNVVAGGNLAASCSIYNLAGATASSSTVGYYLSADAVLDGADQLLGSSQGFSLPVGQASSRFANFSVPAGTAPGGYFVLFAADHLNQVSETNENNNVSAVSITVTPPSIDLSIQQATVNPLNTASGNPINMSCLVVNQGNAPAISSSVGFYFSTNPTLDAADQLLTSQYGAQLSPSFPAQRNGTAAVPGGLAPGTYYILFVADFQSQVGETNEANNVTAVGFTVSPPGVDLVITQEQLFQSTAVAGNQVQASCAVLNQGNTQAGSSAVGFYLSTNPVFDAGDVLLSNVSGPPLAPGQSTFRSGFPQLPAGTAPGSYYVLFVADPQNAVAETNEANNVRGLFLTVVAPSIDLLVQGGNLNPASVAPGSAVNSFCVLYNQGNAPANPGTVGYYLSADQTLDASDVLLGSTSGTVFGGNSAARSTNLTVPTGTPIGAYYVLFVADYQNQVVETNENNNVAAALLQVVAPGVDLLIPQAFLSVSSVTPGFALNTNCAILNAGNTTAASSTVGYYLSTNQTLDANDVSLNTASGFALAANQSSSRFTNLVIPAGTAAGSYYVLFVADPQNAVAETNEGNNVATQLLTVTGPFTGTVVPLSGSATVTTCSSTVYDNGGFSNYADNSNGSLTILPATPGALVQLLFTSFAVEQCCDRLRIYDGPNAQAPLLATLTGLPGVPIVATNASGALTLVFTSDGSVVSAGFEASVSCTAAPRPDLLLTQIGASPSSAPAGGSLLLSATVANLSSGPASSSAVGYYLSTDQVLSANDPLLGTSPGAALGPNLEGARQLLGTVPGNVAPGTYYVLFVADPAGAVSETDETNNLAALAVTVTQVLASREQTAGYVVAVAPNPVANGSALRVQLSGVGAACAATLDLYNALGQRVRSQPLLLGAGRANRADVATQNLATGVYVLRLTGPGLNVTRRVVVE